MSDTYKGPRKVVTARISSDAVLLLETAASTMGITRSRLLTRLLEDWAGTWRDNNRRSLSELLAEERERRS